MRSAFMFGLTSVSLLFIGCGPSDTVPSLPPTTAMQVQPTPRHPMRILRQRRLIQVMRQRPLKLEDLVI